MKFYLENFSQDALFCGIDGPLFDRLKSAAAEILSSPEWLARLQAVDEWVSGHAPKGTNPTEGLPDDSCEAGRWLMVFPILAHLRAARAFYAERGIPEKVLKDTMKDLRIWIDTYSLWSGGKSGFAQIRWLRKHVNGELFALGRLQFMPTVWPNDGFGLYRDGSSGEYSIHRVADMDGSPLRRIAGPGDPVLGIHIPTGEPLLPEACKASIAEAPGFFRRHFPDRPAPLAMICDSWLLYPRLRDLIGPTSNIVSFQENFLLYKLDTVDDGQFYERVFPPWGRAVRRENLRSRLQLALFDDIAAGNIPSVTAGTIPIA